MTSGENILILGCQVERDRPQAMLEARLNRALLLIDARLRTGADVRVVVSGRGEAEIMERWLIDAGVSPGLIVVEPLATSTNENLENAQKLLPATLRWLVVTSDFHVRRTRVWAWHLGIPVRVLAAVTPAPRWRDYLREVIAFPHSVLRVLWRKLRA